MGLSKLAISQFGLFDTGVLCLGSLFVCFIILSPLLKTLESSHCPDVAPVGCKNKHMTGSAASRAGSFTVRVQLSKFTCKKDEWGGLDMVSVQFTLRARSHARKPTRGKNT